MRDWLWLGAALIAIGFLLDHDEDDDQGGGTPQPAYQQAQ